VFVTNLLSALSAGASVVIGKTFRGSNGEICVCGVLGYDKTQVPVRGE